MAILVGDTLYFSANDGSSGDELWAHDTSNASTWRVADITAGLAAVTPEITWRYSSVIRSTSVRMMEAAATNCGLMIPQTPQLGGWLISSGTGSSYPGQYMEILVGDTLYFSANDGSSGHELWAHDTSNASTWRVADIDSGLAQLPRTSHGDTRR